jgi:hypothetical protein
MKQYYLYVHGAKGRTVSKVGQRFAASENKCNEVGIEVRGWWLKDTAKE